MHDQDPATSAQRARAGALVADLQSRHVDRLQAGAASLGHDVAFAPVHWQRDGGRHGGGTRLQAGGDGVFDRASVNLSAVHYDDMPQRALGSATALSAIVHPAAPHAPSMHLHTSWTELKSGRAYWRVMADLNPSLPDAAHTRHFAAALAQAAGALWTRGRNQGDRYFAIPALDRRRGVVHFYLEAHDSGDFDADLALARGVIDAAIDTYAELWVEGARRPCTEADRRAQRAYHTVYLFQVLTLDRGTTSGLMVHGDNDVGILGSLPSVVDPALLASWADRCPAPQGALVRALVQALPADGQVTDAAKVRLAQAVRDHYRTHPQALALQARGDVIPPTVSNHR